MLMREVLSVGYDKKQNASSTKVEVNREETKAW
jgi:hypothetical protein